jgi:hypothetical protein
MTMADNTIAATIAAQMGGAAALQRMTGGRVLFDGATMHLVRLMHGAKCNKLRVTYDDATDTYTVTSWSIRGATVRALERLDGVYADMLLDAAERMTGLALRMRFSCPPTIVRVHVYRAAGEWWYSAWDDEGGFDHVECLNVPDSATDAEALAAAAALWPTADIVRVPDVDANGREARP